MAAGTYNTTMDQGATFERYFDVYNGQGTPTDLTGYTFVAQMRLLPGDTGTPIETFTCTLQTTSQNGSTFSNRIKMSLSASETGAISLTQNRKNPRAKTRFYFDLEITAPAPASVVTRLVEGTIDVSPRVNQ